MTPELFDTAPFTRQNPELFPRPMSDKKRMKLPIASYVLKWLIGSQQVQAYGSNWLYNVRHHFITQRQGFKTRWFETRHLANHFIMVETFSTNPHHYWNLSLHLKDLFYEAIFSRLAIKKSEGECINQEIRLWMERFDITVEDIDPSSIYRMYNRRREEFERKL
jgi:hypothetical protein